MGFSEFRSTSVTRSISAQSASARSKVSPRIRMMSAPCSSAVVVMIFSAVRNNCSLNETENEREILERELNENKLKEHKVNESQNELPERELNENES